MLSKEVFFEFLCFLLDGCEHLIFIQNLELWQEFFKALSDVFSKESLSKLVDDEDLVVLSDWVNLQYLILIVNFFQWHLLLWWLRLLLFFLFLAFNKFRFWSLEWHSDSHNSLQIFKCSFRLLFLLSSHFFGSFILLV